MLAVSDLKAAYGRIPILTGVSFDVADGEFVGVLGHNGMGKTTLLKTLMGFLVPTGGTVRYNDQDITRLSPHERVRRGIGYVPQGREIFPGLSVLENLRMGCIVRTGREESAIEPVLGEFPRLKPLLDRLGGTLSGGEQQLLAIARCLCGGPKLVLLDEPTEGIQPSVIEELVERLQALRLRYGLTVVLVEQNLDFIRALSHRVLIMHKGRIAREVATEEIAEPEMLHEFAGMAG
jgi:branched-chain amino acid transport system ATP-binding protein